MLNAWWFWLTVAVVVFWALGAYNRLVRLKAQVQQTFNQLELGLLQFSEMVQQLLTEIATSPAAWRSDLSPEQGATHWSRLQLGARELAMALARMHEHPLDAMSVEQVRQAQVELQAAWEALVHPLVYQLAVPETMQQRWHAQVLLVQPEAARFNQAVTQYNDAIDQFPAWLIARSFKFEPGHRL
jgi:LemA protein